MADLVGKDWAAPSSQAGASTGSRNWSGWCANSRTPSPTCRLPATAADRKSLSLTLFAGFVSWCCHAGGPEWQPVQCDNAPRVALRRFDRCMPEVYRQRI